MKPGIGGRKSECYCEEFRGKYSKDKSFFKERNEAYVLRKVWKAN